MAPGRSRAPLPGVAGAQRRDGIAGHSPEGGLHRGLEPCGVHGVTFDRELVAGRVGDEDPPADVAVGLEDAPELRHVGLHHLDR
jgi:hypothetical protein